MNKIIQYGWISAIPLYNCSTYTPDEWSERDGVHRPFTGSFDLIFGIVMILLYIPIIAVMFEKVNFRLSCYKIMIFLGIVDILSLGVNSIITGFLAIQGSVYCTYPVLTYCSGMSAIGLWCCSCILALTLVINRVLDLTKPNLAAVIFDGYRTFLILIFPILYGLYFVFFTTPVGFSSKYMAWFTDPLIFKNMGHYYSNIPQVLNNFLVVAATCFLYVVFCFVLSKKLKQIREGSSTSDKLSAQIFIQSTLICGSNASSSVIYVVMNFIDVPIWLTMLGHVFWQCGTGFPILIYLTMNPTIRCGVSRLLGFENWKIQQSGTILQTLTS